MAKYENPIAQAARFRDNMPFDGMSALQQFLQAAATPVNDVPPYGNAREPQPGMGFGPPEAPNMRANINQSGPIKALSGVLNAAASTVGPTRRGPASSWDVPQAMNDLGINVQPTRPMPAGLQSIVDRVMASAPEAAGPNAPPNSIATMISTGNMRAPAVQVGNGIVPNADVRGTYSAGGLDISGPGVTLPGGNVLGGIPLEERTPRRPETLPTFSSAVSSPVRQNTAPLPAREDRARGEPYVTAAQASASRAGGTAGAPISVVRALQNTNYLPVMDAQGRVSYQSEEFMKQKAAEQTAAKLATAKTTAEIDKLLGEGQKARTPAADQRMVNTYLDTLEKYIAPRLQSSDAEVRAKAIEEYLANIEGLISKFGIESTLRRQMAQKFED